MLHLKRSQISNSKKSMDKEPKPVVAAVYSVASKSGISLPAKPDIARKDTSKTPTKSVLKAKVGSRVSSATTGPVIPPVRHALPQRPKPSSAQSSTPTARISIRSTYISRQSTVSSRLSSASSNFSRTSAATITQRPSLSKPARIVIYH
jgi:hypothetical protein